MAKRSKSSKRWLAEHFDDPYVQLAKQAGWRSRAAFKLLEINEKDRLFRPDMTILDLGAAPGGWSQVAARYAGERSLIIASDILPMDTVAGVQFVQGDFQEAEVFDAIVEKLNHRSVDLVISDMAPNTSGIKSIDQPKAMYLDELALDMALQVLDGTGRFLVKAFQGEGFDAFHAQIKSAFTRVVIRKPAASRPRSRELYLLASGKK
jgi:23S rRNA (uridine2552-2'-O)-methyltransferase